ncbi:hypothetical protein USB125703_02051 [Pseudoclavibacter triregionum]|nr:hypothetical protein USB125703_02051 [Pseudoclavibacter triregionum]
MQATPQQVAQFLGRGDDPETVALAGAHLPIVTAFVYAYTRGRGFFNGMEPAPDVAAVIVTATARLVTNPEQVKRVQVADVDETPATLNGFTLPELAVLHLYRRRTA